MIQLHDQAGLNALFRKVVSLIFSGVVLLMVGFILVFTVLLPIIWLANMLGRIDEIEDVDPGWEEKIIDYREDLDKLAEDYHIGFKYSEMLACSMDEKYTHNIKGCIAHVNPDGTFDDEIDTDPSGSFLLYSPDIDEFQGTIPDAAYEDIWIPTLYERDHYRREEVINEETGEPETDEEGNPQYEWVFDYTEEEIYKDACTAFEPSVKCRKTREGFWTFPYIPPAAGEPSERYGYKLINENSNVSIELNTKEQYYSGYVLAVSTGEIVDAGELFGVPYITQRIENNGTELYAKYVGVYDSAAGIGDELEQNEILGFSDEISVKTYFLDEGTEWYFNPMLLFASSQPWKYGDTYHHPSGDGDEDTDPGDIQPGGIMEMEGVVIDFDSKYYCFNPDGIHGNPCVCDANNHIAWPYDRCLTASITGRWNKMICSSYAAGRFWDVNNHDGNFPLPNNWNQLVAIDHVSPGPGTYSRDPNSPIPQSIASIRFGSVRHAVFIEGVGADGSVLISECNATTANSYGFRVRKFSSFQAFLNSYGAVLEGMYGP